LNFIDTHCHLLNLQHKDAALIEHTREALGRGELATCIDVGTGLGDLPDRVALLEHCGVRHCSLGLYPSYSAENDFTSLLTQLEQDIHTLETHPNIHLVAIGEIGIDLHWNYAPAERQAELMIAQIRLANRLDLPVIIHNRLADQAIAQALHQCPPNRGGVMHCFSANADFAVSMHEIGMAISFAGNITYKASVDIQESAKRLPRQAILCETDSPYLSPMPHRGKTNHPSQVRLVYEHLALIRGENLADLAAQVTENAKRVFAL
jgi:TatD DNase family protein